MKSLIFGFLVLAFTQAANGLPMRCLATFHDKDSGRDIYLTLNGELKTKKLTDLKAEMLGSNGFLIENAYTPNQISKVDFKNFESLTFTITIEEGVVATIATQYDQVAGNYQGNYIAEIGGTTQTEKILCMIIKGI